MTHRFARLTLATVGCTIALLSASDMEARGQESGVGSQPRLESRLPTPDPRLSPSPSGQQLVAEAAKRVLAEKMYESIGWLKSLHDTVQVCPGHGAGSMCGAGMSGRATSTMGAERMSNPYLDPRLIRAAFIDYLLKH